jgi:DNA-directed RNA polymerase subunit N (RpoN/RPB10)
MLYPVACFTCGASIGDVAVLYQAVRRARMEARYGRADGAVAPTRAPLDPSLSENIMGDVLDALGGGAAAGPNQYLIGCCRTRCATGMDLSEHY